MDERTNRQYPVHEHMGFQRRFWAVERIGWCLLAAIPLLALTGLFGNGPLSTRTVGEGPQSIEYERFQRVTRLARFVVHMPPSPNGEHRLHFNGDFQNNYETTTVLPAPLRSNATGDGVDMTFAGPADGALNVVLWAHPRAYGSLHLEARIDDGAPLALPTFVYP